MSAVIGVPGEMIRFHVTLPKDSGLGGESMWGEVTGADTLKVANVPFFVDQFGKNDIVRVCDTGPDTIPEYVEVVEIHSYGGTAVCFTEVADEETMAGVMTTVRALGGITERGAGEFWVVDYPSVVIGEKVVAFLNTLIEVGLVDDPKSEES